MSQALPLIAESSDESSSNYDSEDDDEFQETAIKDLEEGNLSVHNKNGSLWCPFCTQKKKTEFKYGELLQHARGVSKGKRGAEAGGVHKALVKYLTANMSHMAEPPKERLLHLEQETPERMVTDEKLVWPWMGVIMNIDNSKIIKGMRVGPGNGEIKSRFVRFNPEFVQTLWNHYGHQGIAVVEFNKDMIGYGDAQDFERSFLESGRGKRAWEQNVGSFDGPGKELYGWVANQHDYNADDDVGKHLRDKGNLRTVAEVNKAWSRQKDQLLQNLDATIQDQNQKLQDSTRQVFGLQSLIIETEKARQDAEMQKVQMEQKHKQELRAVEQEAKRVIHRHDEEIKKERQKLEFEFEKLHIRCQELKNQEVHDDVERIKKEKEMNENEKKIQCFYQIQKLHEEQEAQKMQLIKKQEGESSHLLSDQHKQQKLLLNRHKIEQEIQALKAILESKKLEASGNQQGSSILHDLEEKLKDLKVEKEHLEETNQTLTYKERELNDEVQNARKMAVKVLEKRGDIKKIAVKKMGELDTAPWTLACKQKYKNHPDGWEMEYATTFTKWDSNLRNPQWHPFKTVQVAEKPERVIDMHDEMLVELKKELGDTVLSSMVQALNELEEHNASGRYPIPVPWNYKENRIATLEEIIRFLDTEKAGPKKRRRT